MTSRGSFSNPLVAPLPILPPLSPCPFALSLLTLISEYPKGDPGITWETGKLLALGSLTTAWGRYGPPGS